MSGKKAESKEEIKRRMNDMCGVMNALEVDSSGVILKFDQGEWTRTMTGDKELLKAIDKKAKSIYLRLEKKLKEME